MNVLFVGRANTGRSPLAEALLRERLRRDERTDVEASSAGDSAAAGTAVEAGMCGRALEEGVDLSGHRARRLDASMLSWADLVLVFEPAQIGFLRERGPEGAELRLLAGPGESLPPLEPRDDASWDAGASSLRSAVEAVYRGLPPAGPEAYAQAVERLFRSRTGGALALAHSDWEQIDRWWSTGVPLWIVLEALRDTIRRTGTRGDARRMRLLRYCARGVEERHAAWVRALGRRGGEARATADLGAAASISISSGEAAGGNDEGAVLRCSAVEALDRAAGLAAARGAKRVVELLGEALHQAREAPPAAEAAGERLRLHEIDERISVLLPDAAGDAVLTEERAEAEALLSPHRTRMTPEAWDRTLQRLVLRRLRDRLGIPDLVS